MGKRKKAKKVNPKKEKYAKFRKSKPATNTFDPPDLTPEQQQQRKQDDFAIGTFWRYNRPKKDNKKGSSGKKGR